MTCEPKGNEFLYAYPLSTLVFVDMRKENLLSGEGLHRSTVAGILPNCRAALAFARKIGWQVAFVRGHGDALSVATANKWINGFEPQQREALFDRRSVSCYSSPYFKDRIQETGGAVVFAGYLGLGGCLATGADALFAKQKVTFLTDAIVDDASQHVFNDSTVRLLRAFTSFDITLENTSAWMESVSSIALKISH